METNTLPLKEQSIAELYNGNKATYEVPIYQRNYAWEEDEITALIQDVYDAYLKSKNGGSKNNYYIGTLVSYHKGDQVYEVIDGQQRLTTIYLVLSALDVQMQNRLTYRARKKSNDTIKSIPKFEIDEKDYGIINGYNIVENAINKIVPDIDNNSFKNYFLKNVHLIHYNVPKDIDLNHYFEIMNSRGEQLEKHEIIKARLIEKLNHEDKEKFNKLWEFCSEMNVYIQQKDREELIFGQSHCDFKISNFDDLQMVGDEIKNKTIKDFIKGEVSDNPTTNGDKLDTFQPIIDFPNFLLIVLKLTRILEEPDFKPTDFILDDKELIREFDKLGEKFVKTFAYNLLKARYFLDNYIVHHSNEDDAIGNNPWKLQRWHKDKDNEYPKNLDEENKYQNQLVQLLSMFEVSYTARQRKNYLFYCLLHLFEKGTKIEEYYKFVNDLADKYFRDVYLNNEKLNDTNNTPKPGSFDETILRNNNELDLELHNQDIKNFSEIYGNGTEISKGVPLFVFNYLDYKLWEKYYVELSGKGTDKKSRERIEFFKILGCNDFGLEVFEQFYFSRTRRSLEHFFPQANVDGKEGTPTQTQINCMGNYAMIGSDANSSGSNWSPLTKLSHYLDSSGKIKQVSVASLKFMIMMQKCKDNKKWTFEEMKQHQENMENILLKRKKFKLF